MTLKVRRMKKYNQRRSTKIIKSYKKEIQQLENKIQASVTAFLHATQEGSSSKTTQLCQYAKNILLKTAPDMQKIAEEIGGIFPKRVSDFISSIELILASQDLSAFSQAHVDDAKLRSCKVASQRLEDLLLH